MAEDDAGTGGSGLGDVVAERRRLLSLAFRLTGTMSDAEDVVQETYVRWYRLTDAERDEIRVPAAWLTRVAGRVALDLLGSARVRREASVGQWLPEPVPADLFAATAGAGTPVASGAGHGVVDPADRVTLDDAVSTALLTVLESMTPAERVAFVLHDVFGLAFDEIAQVVGRTPAATRQLATSARRHVREGRRAEVDAVDHDQAVRAFLDATVGGDLTRLLHVLAPDVELRADGGGVVSVAPNVLRGPDHVARFLLGVLAKQPGLRFEERRTADGLGYAMHLGPDLFGIVSLGVRDGRVTDLWLVLDPRKLGTWVTAPDGGRP